MRLKDVLKIHNCFCWSEQLLEGREPNAVKNFIKRFNFPAKSGFNILTKEEATKVVVFVKMCPNQCDGLHLVEGSLKVKEILDELGDMDEITSRWGYDKYFSEIEVFKFKTPLPKLGYYKTNGAIASVPKQKTVPAKAAVKVAEPVPAPKPVILTGLVSPKIVFSEKRLVSREDVEREVKLTLDRIFGVKQEAVQEAAPALPTKPEKEEVKPSHEGYVRGVTLDLFRHILKAENAYNLEKDYFSASERYSRWDSLRHLGYGKYFESRYGSHTVSGEKLVALKETIMADFGHKLG